MPKCLGFELEDLFWAIVTRLLLVAEDQLEFVAFQYASNLVPRMHRPRSYPIEPRVRFPVFQRPPRLTLTFIGQG